MKYLATCGFLLLLASPAMAQEPNPQVLRDQEPKLVVHKEKVADKKFFLVAGSLGGSMAIDLKGTLNCFKDHLQCYEGNPYAAPFVKRGHPVKAFLAGAVFDGCIDLLSLKMKGAKKPLYRKTWWIIPIGITAGHWVAIIKHPKK